MTQKTYHPQTAKFIATVCENMPEFSGEVMQGWIENPKGLQQVLRDALSPDGESTDNVFLVTCEGSYKTSELVARGSYDWVNDWITDERFPIRKHVPVSRTIELVEFDHDPTSEEVLAEFSRRDLERPTYEDALYFGVQHPEEQGRHPVVFLHEPVLDPHGRRVLVLGGRAGRRRLHLGWFDVRWARGGAFAGVRK